MNVRRGVVALAAVAAASGATAQGYFDFGEIPGVPAEPHVQVDLNPALLGFVAEAARAGDPATAELLAGLEGVRVRVYEELDDSAAVGQFVDEASRRLEEQGWDRVVYVQDGEEKVRIYARMDGQQMAGMTVLVTEPSEAVFINIAGAIDPTQLGRIAAAMGVGGVLPPLGGPAGAGPRAAGSDGGDEERPAGGDE